MAIHPFLRLKADSWLVIQLAKLELLAHLARRNSASRYLQVDRGVELSVLLKDEAECRLWWQLTDGRTAEKMLILAKSDLQIDARRWIA
jgi:hypothetical protein